MKEFVAMEDEIVFERYMESETLQSTKSAVQGGMSVNFGIPQRTLRDNLHEQRSQNVLWDVKQS